MSSNWSAKRNGIVDNAIVRAVGLDDWSAVRQLHGQSFNRLAGVLFDENAAAAMRQHLEAPEYTEELARHNLSIALVDGHVVGTCGWVASDDHGHAARITSLFVDPLFTRLGIGRRLVWDAEARARAAGFQTLTTRATEVTIEYFSALGYELSSQGVATPAPDLVIPVIFMRKHEQATASLKPGSGSGSKAFASEPPEEPPATDPTSARSLAFSGTRH